MSATTTMMYAAFGVAYSLTVRAAKAICFHYCAWQYHVQRNEAALAESDRPPGGSMSFRKYLRNRPSRLVYGALYRGRDLG